MLDFRVSETSPRIPVALFILELVVFFAAVLATAYFDLFLNGEDDASLAVWLLRATVFSAAMMISMALFKLYQGRPTERMGIALVRLASSFALGGLALYALYFVVPLLRIAPLALVATGVLSFFVLSTVRPVFLDSVTERRGRRRNNFETVTDTQQTPDVTTGGDVDEGVSQDEFLARVSRNAAKPTTLTGQHRITRRGL